MQRLIKFLSTQAEGTKVLIVGFTDDVGAFDSNRDLSVSRAQQIVQDIRFAGGEQIAGLNLSATGYGEVAPSSCNTTEGGRSINRRVEVWIEAAQQG